MILCTGGARPSDYRCEDGDFISRTEAQCKPIYIPFSPPCTHPHLPLFETQLVEVVEHTHRQSRVEKRPMTIKFIRI